MNIGFFINDVRTEHPHYATTSLARAALRRGHTPWYIGINDFAYDPDGQVCALARSLPNKKYKSNETFLAALQSDDAPTQRLTSSDLDVLLLRNNPADDATERPWAQSVGIIFGQIAASQGVLVLNDPNSLANALNKLYFQFFPEEVRPRTLISRNPDELKAFVEAEEGQKVILKPLQGSGGQGVFMVDGEGATNLNQIIEAISRDGYVVAQEFLPAAAEGDLRMFLVNGRPLEVDGEYAAIFRRAADDDVRSNIHAGGTAEAGEVTETALRVAELVRPKLIEDGMFLVGLDIAGDKLLEVNVFSPGGLHSMERFTGKDFSGAIIEALEQKVAIAQRYGLRFSNTQLATM